MNPILVLDRRFGVWRCLLARNTIFISLRGQSVIIIRCLSIIKIMEVRLYPIG